MTERFVRFIKQVDVPIEQGESTMEAVERADMLDADASLEYILTTQIVDKYGEVIEEI